MKLTIKSFLDKAANAIGQNKPLTMLWLRRTFGPREGSVDGRLHDERCLAYVDDLFAGKHGNAADSRSKAEKFGIPLTMWEALAATYELWPELFEDDAPSGDMSTVPVDSAVLVNLAKQLDRMPGTAEKVVIDDNGNVFPNATIIEAKRMLEDLSKMPSKMVRATEKVNEDRIEAFLKEHFPTEFDKYSSCLKPSLVMEQIMLQMRDDKRPTEAFPKWEESWEQINRLAEIIFNDVTGPAVFDSQRVAMPQAVVDEVVRLLGESKKTIQSSVGKFPWRITEPGDMWDHAKQARDRLDARLDSKEELKARKERRRRAKVVTKVFTKFMNELLDASSHEGEVIGDDEALKAIRLWDSALHSPKWLGPGWFIDEDGELQTGDDDE